jgi:hypothetical protein
MEAAMSPIERPPIEDWRQVLRRTATDSDEALTTATGPDATQHRAAGWDAALIRQIRAEATRTLDDDASAVMLRACADALQRMLDVPALRQAEHLGAIDRALQAVSDRLARLDRLAMQAEVPPGGDPPAASDAFAAYRAVQHIAGAPRVHPADLWPCPDPWLPLPVDPFVAPRAVDAGVLEALEAALLALLRQSGPEPSDRMSGLCAALAEGSTPPSADLWRMAAAVYEGQREGLIASDVYLKRLGSRLLALAREVSVAPAGQPPGTLRQRMTPLAHELLFFCVHAQAADASQAPRLAAVQGTYRSRLTSVVAGVDAEEPVAERPETGSEMDAAIDSDIDSDIESAIDSAVDSAAELPSASRPETGETRPPPSPPSLAPGSPALSLVQAVPGLPSMADLDLDAGWPDEEPLPEDVRQIGPLRIPIARFNAFLAESDELSRRLGTLLDEWRVEAQGAPPQAALETAQALAVEAAAIGHDGLAALCAALAEALQRCTTAEAFQSEVAERFVRAHGQLQRLLHTFAAGFLRPVDLAWVEALRGGPEGLADAEAAASGAPGEAVAAATPALPEPLQRALQGLRDRLRSAGLSDVQELVELERALTGVTLGTTDGQGRALMAPHNNPHRLPH